MAGAILTGGGFQDCLGNPLALGRLVMALSVDAVDILTDKIQICSGEEVSYALDAHGNIAGTPSIWINPLITPTSYYMARVYSQSGQLAWGPNAISVFGTPVNATLWIPGNPA